MIRKILIAIAVVAGLALAGCGAAPKSAPVAHTAAPTPSLTASAAVATFKTRVGQHTFWTTDCLAGRCKVGNGVGADALGLLKRVPHGEQRYNAFAGIANAEFKLLDKQRLGGNFGDKRAVPKLFADECHLVDYADYGYGTCVKTTGRFLSHYHLAGGAA